jgi:tRNA(fMet)-specific endonuclease VapC
MWPLEICITAVTVAELLFGAYNSRRVAANVTKVGELQNVMAVLDTITTAVADHFGRNKALLRRSGRPIGDLEVSLSCVLQPERKN